MREDAVRVVGGSGPFPLFSTLYETHRGGRICQVAISWSELLREPRKAEVLRGIPLPRTTLVNKPT